MRIGTNTDVKKLPLCDHRAVKLTQNCLCFPIRASILLCHSWIPSRGESRGAIGLIAPLKLTKVTTQHDFVQFVKQHSRYKAILPSIVLSQQCCGVYFITLTVAIWDFTTKYYWIFPPNPAGWIRPWTQGSSNAHWFTCLCVSCNC